MGLEATLDAERPDDPAPIYLHCISTAATWYRISQEALSVAQQALSPLGETFKATGLWL